MARSELRLPVLVLVLVLVFGLVVVPPMVSDEADD